MKLLDTRGFYKPFKYPQMFAIYKKHQAKHWVPEEIQLSDDVSDWHKRLTEDERTLLTQIFRFFTQTDCDVLDGYGDLINTFKGHPEVTMCLTNIADRECIHVESYSLLLDTIGIPETEYKAFYEYEEMAAKHEYLQEFGTNSYEDIARKLAITGAFTEGVQLFSSFVILMNFRRFGKMNGMCKVVEFSIKDEDDHVACCIELYKQFVKEYLTPEQVTKVTEDLIGMCRKTVDLEDKFVDLAFNTANNNIEGLTKEEVKQYIRFMANLRLTQLGLDPIYNVLENPLPWLDWVVYGKGHTNFFENRETEYAKGALQGEWDEVSF